MTSRLVTQVTTTALAFVAAGVLTPASATEWTQPYGGCVEAHSYTHSLGARECRQHGWLIRPRIVVGPHDHVRFNVLPPCRYEDGSTERGHQRHCFWNAHTRGNHRGDSFILDHVNGGARITYVLVGGAR